MSKRKPTKFELEYIAQHTKTVQETPEARDECTCAKPEFVLSTPSQMVGGGRFQWCGRCNKPRTINTEEL